jgi:hypothetical protein
MMRFWVKDESYQVDDEYGQLFDPRCVAWLDYIIQKTGAKIVISSTWRMSGLKVMQNLWRDRKLPGEVIDITCGRGYGKGVDPELIKRHLTEGADRGYEIQQWLEDHPEVTRYVILDDDIDMCTGQNFVHTPGKFGLENDSTDKAIIFLNGK